MDNNEKFKLVSPTIEHKEQAIDYINEHRLYNAETSGTGGLIDRLNNYEQWLQEIDEDRNLVPYDIYVPTETYFLVRENDNKIIGMTRIRLELNDHLRKTGGNIEYGIRPTERRKGYNKINLYLALLECQKRNMTDVMLDCDKNNIGSAKTIQALCGRLTNESWIEAKKAIMQAYWINVEQAIEMNHEYFDQFVSEDEQTHQL